MRNEGDDGIDRGWFANEQAGFTAEPTVVPASVSDAPLSAARWEQVRATLETYEREVAASVDPRRRAALSYEIGRIHESELGDPRRAVRFYQRAFRADPTHLPTLQAGQRIFSRAGRWAMVLRLAEAEVRAHPSVARKVELLRMQGDIYLSRFRQPDHALACLRRALELRPSDADTARSVAIVADLLGEHAVAAEALTCAAQNEAEEALGESLAVAAAQARLSSGDPAAAAGVLEGRLIHRPGDPEVLEMLGRVYRIQGRWTAYVDVMARLAAARPPSQRALLLTDLARTCAEELDDVVGALALLDQAVKADARAPMALELVVELRSRSGQWAAAAEALERLVAATDDPVARTEHLWQLALVRLERLGDETGAIAALERLLIETPSWQPAVRTLGRLLAERGDWAAVVALHEAEVATMAAGPARAARAFKIGEIHELQLDDPAAAARAYRRANSEDPDFLLAGKALGRMLVRLGDWPGFVALLEGEAQRAPDVEAAVYAFSRIAEICALNLDDPDRAIAAWRRVLELQPDHLEAVRNVARLCARTGRWADLLAANEREIELVEGDGARLALFVRSAELSERVLGDLERARNYLEQALALDGRYLPALQAMGRIAQRTRRWSELCELYRIEVELTEAPLEQVNLHTTIGELLRDRLDDPDGAIAAFEAALDLAPDHLPSLRALQRLYALKGAAAREAEVIALEVAHVHDAHARAMLLDRLGRLYAERLDQPELAAAAWGQAVDEVPDFRQALQGLLDAQAEAGDYAALAETHRRLARSAVSVEESVSRWLEVARICTEHLSQPFQAVDALETVIRLAPGHLGALLGLERLYQGQVEAVELERIYGALLEVVQAPASRADVLCRRARLSADHLGDLGAARDDYLAALEYEPERREPLVWVEAYAAESGDVERLAAVLQRRLAVSDAPNERQTVLGRAADVLRRSGRLKEAAGCYEAVLDMDPDAVVAIRALREVYEELGDGERALRLAEAEGRRSLDPQTAASLLVEAGNTREAAERDPEAALADYLEALARNPEDAAAEAGVRRICQRSGRWETLAEALEERAHASPRARVERLLEVASLRATRLNQPGAAIEVLHRAASAGGEEASPALLQRLADLYTELGAWRQAADVYATLCERCDDAQLRRAVVYRLAAIYAEKLADPRRAAECLDLIIQEHPEEIEARARLARILTEAGDFEGARRHLSAAITQTGDPLRAAPLCGRLARLEADAGELHTAAALLEPALAALPDDFELAELFAAICVRLGQPRRLRAALEPAIAAAADLPSAANRLRRLLARQSLAAGGEVDAALADLETAIAAAPDDVALRETHAELAGRSEQHLGAAMASRRWLAMRAPLDARNLRALRALCTRAERHDVAYELARLLSGLDEAGDGEAEAIHSWHGGVRRWPARPLEEVDRQASRAPGEPAGLAAVLRTLERALPDIFAPAGQRSAEAPQAIEDVAARVAEALALEPAPAVRVDARGLDTALPSAEGLVLGASLTDLSGGERAFVIATHLELNRRGLTALTRWSPVALRGLLESLAAAGGHPVKGVALSADQIASRSSALVGRLAQLDDPAVTAALLSLHRVLPGLDLAAARAAYLVSAHRVALLVCGGVLPALNGLRWMAGGAPLTRVPGLSDLIRWVISEPYFIQRRSLGLAPAS